MSITEAAKKILIVDDDPRVVDVLRDFFEQRPEPFVIETASNGDDAVMSVRRDVPDLVLLDIHMPIVNGVAALQRILGIDRSIRVMMITGRNDALLTEALRLGAFASFPKPIDLGYLAQLVPLALEQRRTPRLRFGEA
jgi:DNA-binding NtrC family response regulator